jgi:hypothetical protein
MLVTSNTSITALGNILFKQRINFHFDTVNVIYLAQV